MRKILSLILDHFVIIICGTILGLFVFNQYFNSISLVAGKNLSFSKEAFFYGLFQTLPVTFFLVSFASVLYKIRHKSYPKASFITYCCLSLITWGVFFPITLTFQKKVFENMTPINELKNNQPLSGNYFRKSDGKIYYFIKDSSQDLAPVFLLSNPDNPESFAEEKSIDISPESDFSKNSEPFRDPLSHESMRGIPYALIETFSSLKIQAFNSWHNGIIAWLCYCSFGFALCSVYSFIKFSSWKMINAYLNLTFTGLIIWFNYFYYTSKCQSFRNFLRSFFYDGGKLMFFTDRSIEFPLMLINSFIGLVLLTCGIIISILRNQEER